MRKSLTAAALALFSVHIPAQQEAASPEAYYSITEVRQGSRIVHKTRGQHSGEGACLSQYALVAAQTEMRARSLVLDGWCRAAGSTGGFGPKDYHFTCNANSNPQAAGRLLGLGLAYSREKKAVAINSEDVLAICTTSRPVAPQAKLEPVK